MCIAAYKCFQARKLVLRILQWLGFIQNLRDAIMLGGLGACPVKIMILEVSFFADKF